MFVNRLKPQSLAPLIALLAILAFSATSASAETLKPWWHVVSGSRPSNIQPGAAGDAVRQLTVSASSGSYELVTHDPGESISGELQAGEEPSGMQAAIEGMYGSAVEVTAKPGPNNANEVYDINFVGYGHRYPPSMKVRYRNVEGENLGLVGGSKSASVKQLAEGRPAGVLVVTVDNVGETLAVAATSPVHILDTLPAGLQAAGEPVAITPRNNEPTGSVPCTVEGSSSRVSCTFSGGETELPEQEGEERSLLGLPPLGGLPPDQYIEIRIPVEVQPDAIECEPHASTCEKNQVSVSGGGAPAQAVSRPVTIDRQPAQFGVEDYELTPEEPGGKLDTQAGSHPFQTGFDLVLDQDIEEGEQYKQRPIVHPVALAKDLRFKLPPGLVGNPTAIPHCTLGQFLDAIELHNECPADSAVGVATLSYLEPELGSLGFTVKTVPVYNIEPQVGEPARFGMYSTAGHVGIFIDTAVRTGGDYGVTSITGNIDQAVSFISANVTLWGVPGNPAHNSVRGWSCLAESQGIENHEELREKYGGLCIDSGVPHSSPFLSLPTSCPVNATTGRPEPLQSSVEADSWENPGDFLTGENVFTTQAQPLPVLDGCSNLQFVPEIKVTTDGTQASKPTGLNVDVHVPQEGQLNAEGLAQSNIKDIEVTLPAGVTLNPSAANGLAACSGNTDAVPGTGQLGTAGDQVGYTGSAKLDPGSEPENSTPQFTPYMPGSTDAKAAVASHEIAESEGTLEPGKNFCPDASKVASVKIKTPLLTHELEGAVYLASPQNFSVFPAENLFGTHVAMYLVAEDPVSGSLVKLPGRVELGEPGGSNGLAPGQIRSFFEDNPQLPFEDAEVHFFGGERAPLAMPAFCSDTPAHPGEYTTEAVYTPWAGGAQVRSQSSFKITSGPGGSPCPGTSLPFTPSLATGTTSNNAGGFSNLTTTLSRPDGNQSIQSVALHYPPGLSGLLSGVELCGEAQANAGTCGPNSQIGETIVSVGLGGDPFTVTGGKAFITGPYEGAPFGLSIVNPAKAGPFDLQQGRPVVVRAKIEVNRETAALTIVTNELEPYAIPNMIEGFPLQIQHVNVLVNRPGFTFNPTNCAKMEVTGVVKSSEGGSAQVNDPFQATNCQALAFTPKFNVSTAGHTSKALGASLTAKVTEPAGAMGTQANIARVKVDLPLQLPSQLKTLQKACLSKTFEEGFEKCLKVAPDSKIGEAVVHTPLLPVPLRGPAIFVSHGGEAFPSLTIVLQGYGVTVDLVGSTFIHAGITSTTFKTVPDVPFSTFELTIPQGKYAALAANLPEKDKGNLCGQNLKMPTEFLAQNGAKINEDTQIAITGCAKVKALTRAQKLQKALRACRSKDKRNKGRRQTCEKAARKRYGPVKKSKKRAKR